MYEYFKKLGFGAPEWEIDDAGITIKGTTYPFDMISSVSLFSKPTALTNGVIRIFVGKKAYNLAFNKADERRGMDALSFITTKLQNPDAAVSVDDSQDRNADLVIFQPDLIDEVMDRALSVIPVNEKIYVALKGAFKEYLYCTDKKVYIYKVGYMTGHIFGGDAFSMPYANITNAEVDFHLTTGYFELSSGGLQNQKLDYWSTNNSPQKAPNAISLTGTELRSVFTKAANFINDKAAEAHIPHAQQVIVQQTVGQTKSLKEQLTDLKDLLDAGIITQEEFDTKKRQILGL